MQINLVLSYLALQVFNLVMDVSLEAWCACRGHNTAHVCILLIKGNTVPSLGCGRGSFHAAGAGANDKDVQVALGSGKLKLTLAHTVDIYSAGPGVAFHGVKMTLAASDAGIYIVELALLDLVCPVGVGNEAVTDGDQID